MAVLGIALAGAGIGSAFGYAAVGWTIGATIGNVLFAPGGQDTSTEGSRLGDLSVSSSSYGAPIPILYGTMRMNSNLIWSEGIEEVKHIHKTSIDGGFFGGSSSHTTITWSYYATFAVAFCEGEVDDVLRVWMDGKPVHDKTGTNDDIIKAGVVFRFYGGSETQEPDGIIEAAEGVGSTPALRGMCGMVFDRLPLADYGNRIPNITAELAQAFTAAQNYVDADLYTSGEGGIAASIQSGSYIPDYDRGVFYGCQSSATVGQNILRRFNTRTMAEDRQQAYTLDALGNDVDFMLTLGVMPNGYIIARSDNGNSVPINQIDPNTLGIVDTFGVANASVDNQIDSFCLTNDGLVAWIQTPDEVYVFTGSVFDSLGLLRCDSDGLTYVWDSDTDPLAVDVSTNARIKGVCPGAIGDSFGEGYAIAGPTYGTASSDSVNLYKITVDSGAFYNAVALALIGTEIELLATWTPADLVPGETDLENVKGPIYDPTDDTIMLQVVGDSDSQAYMIKYAPTTATILWRTEINATRNEIQGFNHSRITDGTYGQMDAGAAWALYTSTGELFYEDTWSSPTQSTSGASWWDSRTGSLIGAGTSSPNLHKWYFFRGSGDGAGLDTIVSDLCQRAGLAASDIDVTDLASVTVPGYAVSRQMSARAAIQALVPLYYFDGVESDWQLKFMLRDGKSSSATITQDDLGLLDGSEFFRETRTQEVELPMRYSLTYMDKDNDYQQATHSAKRIIAPTAAVDSKNELGAQVAVALAADTVKQATEKGLYMSWVERSNYALKLAWEYLALDPADVITINLDDGTSFRARLVQTDLGANLEIDIGALSEDAAQYASTVSADAGTGGPVHTFLSVAKSKLIILCSPLLRDRDDVSRTVSRVYYFMGGYGQPGWPAGTLYKSSDGANYSDVGSIISEMAWGTAANALGTTVTPFMTDNTNTLTVHMAIGATELTSVTYNQMLNGANAAALIHSDGNPEIINFQDVTTNADGSRTLSGLLRGRRGTDVFVGSHQAGETFLLLTASDGALLPLTLGEVDATRYYRAVTSGERFEDSDILTKASPGNDLKPYAVVHQTATIDGSNNIDFAWVRRTRVGGDLLGGIDVVPISEDSEEYEIDIYDGPGGSIVRTVTSLSSPAYQYTSANQTTDGFSPPLSAITVMTYQVSAQVGRGFSQEVTLNVE